MSAAAPAIVKQKLDKGPSKMGTVVFAAVLLVGFIYTVFHLASDLASVRTSSVFPFILLGAALLVALGFEFVNGFHDTANAVATVIYTHTMDPHLAVAWSGIWNFIGVMFSTGAVAFGIVALLPVELILQVGTSAGFAMVFALLLAAMVWNIGTWYFGLPASSSHTLVGSIVGVGIANQLMSHKTGMSGVDWTQAMNVGRSLLISPVIGFLLAGLLLLISKAVIKDRRLYEAPATDDPPPFWIRGLLMVTCTGVSFFHGSNDGQKGMGLIMLILIGTVPTAYALNHAVTESQTAQFMAVSQQTVQVLNRYVTPSAFGGDPREALTNYIRTKQYSGNTVSALRAVVNDLSNEANMYKTLAKIPTDRMRNFRNDMYITSEVLRLMGQSGRTDFTPAELQLLATYKKQLDLATKFIPLWVKVAVALALGLGTMIGWKRIVVTVGEKIGKGRLTYGQGAAAELTAMVTIGAADHFGLPVSTTHVLSSGVGGTMVANRSGLQRITIRNILLAWALTLPASIILAGSLFWLLRNIF
ncbi:MAG TPA: inorganic phosphate transporter [Bryobacteraceae bacterium]|nr:inorganic phosphate transporter [Bryobacteraceae bacterium]